MHLDLPRAGEQDVRVVRVHRQARAAGVRVDEEHALPVPAAVRRPVDAALLLRAGRAAERAGEDDVRVRRVDDDPADAARLAQAHVRPGLAGVGRLVDAVAHHVDVADGPRFARSGPDDTRRGRRDIGGGRGTIGQRRKATAINIITLFFLNFFQNLFIKFRKDNTACLYLGTELDEAAAEVRQ